MLVGATRAIYESLTADYVTKMNPRHLRAEEREDTDYILEAT